MTVVEEFVTENTSTPEKAKELVEKLEQKHGRL